jgi:hypothetical protein
MMKWLVIARLQQILRCCLQEIYLTTLFLKNMVAQLASKEAKQKGRSQGLQKL